MARSNRRLHEKKHGHYHAFSRVAGPTKGYYPFEELRERELFAAHLDKLSQFFFVYIGFYAFMGNHFHLLFEILDEANFSDIEVQVRWETYYAKALADGTRTRPDWKDPKVMAMIRKHMMSLSDFLHDAKGQFAQEYNARHERRGAFWEARFGLTVLDASAVARCARYIELNPLRARIEEKVGAAGRNSWHNFEKSCGPGEADFSKHPGFQMLVKTLNPDPQQPLSAGEELELALKTLAAWRETFAAEEKRLAEERAEAALAKAEERVAQIEISRRKSPFDAVALGSRSFCIQKATDWECDYQPVQLEDGLFGLFRRERRRV